MNNSTKTTETQIKSANTNLSCRQLDAFLVDYMDDNLNQDLRNAFESHINVCPPCVQYIKDYKLAIEIGQSAFDNGRSECNEKIPEELVSAILKASKS